VNPALTQAATTVLQFHSSNESRTSADSLLDQTQAGKVATPLVANTTLQNPAIQTLEPKPTTISPVPLPIDDDDFDI
jgi:hypothetical protein